MFTTLVGAFESDNISDLIDRIIKGRIPLDEFDSEKMYLTSKIDCGNVKESTKDDLQDVQEDEILKEIIEEEKKKREEFEQNRQRAYQKGKKNAKGTKKKEKNDL